MDQNQITQGTVKVIGHRIDFDWIMPFKIKSSRTSVGSGFFIDKEGHFLTSAHVVSSSKKIDVEIPFEGSYKHSAEVRGICPDFDIALLKIDKKYKPKHFLTLGNSDDVKPGDSVMAFGFPLGQKNLKITKGVVSGRQFGTLQTDTALNPGNSGGPLVMSKGMKVIGINYSIIMGGSNVGYAIPINDFKTIVEELKSGNVFVRRPILGLTWNNTNEELLNLVNAKCKKGIFINYVYPDSPMDKIGLKIGHILCGINGKQIDEYGLINKNEDGKKKKGSNTYKMTVNEIVRTFKKNQHIPIEFWNGKKMVKTDFKYSEYYLPIRMKYPTYEKVEYEMLGGIIFMEVATNHVTKMAGRLNKYEKPRHQSDHAIVITDVLAGSEANNLEVIQTGDIVSKINGQKVKKIKHVREALLKPIKSGSKRFYTIMTDDRELVVLDLIETLKYEGKLAQQFQYRLEDRDVYQKLAKKYNIKEDNTKSTKNNKMVKEDDKEEKEEEDDKEEEEEEDDKEEEEEEDDDKEEDEPSRSLEKKSKSKKPKKKD